ncbi:MAG: hypothetical protein JJE47_08435 [Acidimicrobiia bacterium]|nr:hypothetical protein [Acidimicrobiia bacterium]
MPKRVQPSDPVPGQPHDLISVLLDRSAPYGDSDHGAMDLGAYDDPEVAGAHEQICADPTEDRERVDSCRESLLEIGLRRTVSLH